jgi:hypothetical protein
MLGKVSLTALLQERATRQPDATAYTFIDYELDPNGLSQSLTWAQLHRRAQDSGNESTTSSASTAPTLRTSPTMCVTREQLFYGGRYSYNRFAESARGRSGGDAPRATVRRRHRCRRI